MTDADVAATLPVLLEQVVEYCPQPGQTSDCTCGLAGHSLALGLGFAAGRLVCLDQDDTYFERQAAALVPVDRTDLVQGNFSDIDRVWPTWASRRST